jgi:DNA-binding response OmpR family regulator
MKLQKKKVLIVDCHEDILIALERLLETEGYETATAWSGSDAMQLLESGSFDIALVNEYLPDVDCEDLLRSVGKNEIGTACIIMQPSARQITDSAQLQRLGAVDIVCKYEHEQILAALNRVKAMGRQVATL